MRATFLLIAVAFLAGCATKPDPIDLFVRDRNTPLEDCRMRIWMGMDWPVKLPATASIPELVAATISKHNDGVNKWIEIFASFHDSKQVNSERRKLITKYKIRKFSIAQVDPWPKESTLVLLQTNLGEKIVLSHYDGNNCWESNLFDPISISKPIQSLEPIHTSR